MQIIYSIAQLKEVIASERIGKKVGFVPTMGALHQGHMSLIKKAGQLCDIVVASIFVNPTQFNDKGDLERYPRCEDQDVKLLEENGCSIVFIPSVEEIYPEPDTRTFDFGLLGEVMEGKNRPGHFNGVAQIVSKLFDCVEPDMALFGQKDYQQLAIIRQMTKSLGYNIEIVGCEICRADDGLALSSRNMLLTQPQREAAPLIYKTLKAASQMEWDSATSAQQWVVSEIEKSPLLKVEYFEIADQQQLQPITDWATALPKQGFAVVLADKVRLIDNISFK